VEHPPELPALIGLGAIFTLFFVSLGPIKILGPFSQLTRDLDEGKMNWQISMAAVTLAGAIIFFIVGLRLLLEQYQPASAPPAPLPAQPMAAALRLAFPTVVTPYGIAAIIGLLANSPEFDRTVSIVAMLTAVMGMNLAAMLYVRRIMGGGTVVVLQIVGAVLGVLQVALAMQFMIRGLRLLGVLA
jgi:multiple antibiotic resistance protein